MYIFEERDDVQHVLDAAFDDGQMFAVYHLLGTVCDRQCEL